MRSKTRRVFAVSLPAVAVLALAACSLLALYKPCAWMAALKQRSRAPWLSYF